jgi:hypothetical protein
MGCALIEYDFDMLDDTYRTLAEGGYPEYRNGFLAGLDRALRPNFKERPPNDRRMA